MDQATLAQNWATFCAGGTVGPYRGVEFGVHESCASYARCRTTSRNQGLYTADQALGGNDASYTRQQANQNRFGLECQEERDYYPYWNPSGSPHQGTIATALRRPDMAQSGRTSRC